MDIIGKIASELGVKTEQVNAAVTLLDEGNTVPFIARYRKDVTGYLNDEQLRTLSERLEYLRSLEERKAQVMATIEEQGALTQELKKKIENAQTLAEVEDLYLPYRPKRRTRASIAKERGLEPLADLILLQKSRSTLEEMAAAYVDPEKEVPDTAAALAGASDIIAERISENADYRAHIREQAAKEGLLVSKAKDPQAESVYETYYDYTEPASKAAGHRILALNRGEKEKILSVSVEMPDEKNCRWLEKRILTGNNEAVREFLANAIADAYTRLIAPAIERDIRSELTTRAQDGAIEIFGKNLRQLLMQPPIAGRTVLGWDPAFRTGCKLAVVDPSGKVLDTAVIFPTAPTNAAKQAEAERVMEQLIRKYHVSVFSVGNGTASRESEQFIAQFLEKHPDLKVQYVIVSEAGASVYSASKLATEEFPNFDVGQRSAASIARRLQDPLAELVKIDPKSIGVGQYQHDLNQKKLSEALDHVVEDCVNAVGVDLNTASAALLSYISGLTKTVAANIVAYREENGPFTDRRQLMKVPKLGAKAFEQCAGFLRIRGGKNPLDATAVHPESYAAAQALMEHLGLTAEDLGGEKVRRLSGKHLNFEKLAEETGTGVFTLQDIVKEMEKPGRDPRADMPAPILRSDVLEMKDLTPGMILKGTVRNVIDFGAFVDIGVHQDGLVHISRMKKGKFIKHPMEVVKVGDIIDVKVLEVDVKKGRIALTMILD